MPQNIQGSPASTESTNSSTNTQSKNDDLIVIIVIIAAIVAVIILTIVYVLYQRRKRINRRKAQTNRGPDGPDNAGLITPVKAVNQNQSRPVSVVVGDSEPVGLVSGLRAVPTRSAVPKKWYDSAAIKYMDQSTDTLDKF